MDPRRDSSLAQTIVTRSNTWPTHTQGQEQKATQTECPCVPGLAPRAGVPSRKLKTDKIPALPELTPAPGGLPVPSSALSSRDSRFLAGRSGAGLPIPFSAVRPWLRVPSSA